MTIDIEQLIIDSLPYFVSQEATEKGIVEILLEQQVPATLATQIVLFVPVAFGRAFMQKFQLDFPATFVLNYPSGPTLAGLPFANEPVYNAAKDVATTIIYTGKWQEDFHFEVASWSPEVHVVSQALVEGYTFQSLTLRELHINGDIGPRSTSSSI